MTATDALDAYLQASCGSAWRHAGAPSTAAHAMASATLPRRLRGGGDHGRAATVCKQALGVQCAAALGQRGSSNLQPRRQESATRHAACHPAQSLSIWPPPLAPPQKQAPARSAPSQRRAALADVTAAACSNSRNTAMLPSSAVRARPRALGPRDRRPSAPVPSSLSFVLAAERLALPRAKVRPPCASDGRAGTDNDSGRCSSPRPEAPPWGVLRQAAGAQEADKVAQPSRAGGDGMALVEVASARCDAEDCLPRLEAKAGVSGARVPGTAEAAGLPAPLPHGQASAAAGASARPGAAEGCVEPRLPAPGAVPWRALGPQPRRVVLPAPLPRSAATPQPGACGPPAGADMAQAGAAAYNDRLQRPPPQAELASGLAPAEPASAAPAAAGARTAWPAVHMAGPGQAACGEGMAGWVLAPAPAAPPGLAACREGTARWALTLAAAAAPQLAACGNKMKSWSAAPSGWSHMYPALEQPFKVRSAPT